MKHDRANNLEKGNIGNLLRALGALFILNIYFKNEIYNVEKDGNATNFPVNMGSNIFSIKLHKWSHYDVEFNYEKSNDFDECIYFTKYTDDSIEKIKKAQQEMNKRKVELFLSHSKLLEYLKSNNISNYEVNDLMWDILGKDDYIRLINIAGQDFFKIMENSKYEAILNKNYV